jgi:hypothetical protein
MDPSHRAATPHTWWCTSSKSHTHPPRLYHTLVQAVAVLVQLQPCLPDTASGCVPLCCDSIAVLQAAPQVGRLQQMSKQLHTSSSVFLLRRG